MLLSKHQSHSSNVAINLHVNGDTFNVAKVGSARCILRNPQPHVAGDARLVISIDGRAESTDVYLPDGISADNSEVRYEIREATSRQS